VHSPVGKSSFSKDTLLDNIGQVIKTIFETSRQVLARAKRLVCQRGYQALATSEPSLDARTRCSIGFANGRSNDCLFPKVGDEKDDDDDNTQRGTADCVKRNTARRMKDDSAGSRESGYGRRRKVDLDLVSW
jgi:hypothetical protein